MAAEVKRATENLTCPVCFQLYKNPKYLPCYHYYCEECLKKIQKQRRITCPECRKESTMPAGGVEELPNNFMINRLMDDLVLRRKDEETVTCDGCDSDEMISAYCPNCNLFLCCSCYANHKKTSACHDISTVSLSSNRSSSQSSEFMCEEHEYELKHYCDTCDKLICLYCTTKDHNNHDHDIVKKKVTKQRDEMKKITAPLKGMAENLSKACEYIDRLLKSVQEQCEELDAKIDKHYDELFKKLMAQKEQLKNELSIAVLQVGKIATARQERMKNVLERLVQVKRLNQSIEEGSDQEALATKHQLVDSMENLDAFYKKLPFQPLPSPEITYTHANKLLPQFGLVSVFGKPFSIGDVTNSKIENIPRYIFKGKETRLEIITKDCDGRNCPVGGCEVVVHLENDVGQVMAAQVHDNNNGSYTASFTIEQVGNTILSVFINGQHIKGSPHYFTVFKNYLAICSATITLTTIDNITFGNVWGIAFGENNLWAASDNSNHCVYFFNNRNQLVRKIGQTGTRKGQFQSPRGITFDNTNHLYVADHKNDRVQKFSIDGQYLLQLDSYALNLSLASKFYKMNAPTGITTYDNRVYVTEKSSNGCISVFQSDGRFCFTFGTKELSDPYDITVRNDGQLVVADCVKNCIYVYTPDGIFLRRFGTGGTGRGRLNSPFSLTSDTNLFMFIADTWNHRVTIFDKDGNYVHCFGSEGSANDQLKRPHGIALGPEGKIYLSDYGNSRIQIF